VNDQNESFHFHKPVGQVVAPQGHAFFTQCPGVESCPYGTKPVGSKDAKEENEFYKDTGIRAGPEARSLLIDFQRRHKLKWQGSKSIRRMWQHRTLEYVDGDPQLRIVYSRIAELYGWAVFAFGVFTILLAVLYLPVQSSQRVNGMEPALLASLMLVFGMAVAFMGIEFMVAPERMAKRLLNKESSA